VVQVGGGSVSLAVGGLPHLPPSKALGDCRDLSECPLH
jgi:hypothetical protein